MIDDFNEENEVTGQPMNLWNYKEQPEILGKIIRIEKGRYSDRQIVLESASEEVVLPSLTALMSKLMDAEELQKVKIKYLGDKKSTKTGRLYADFKVWIK